MRIPTRHPMTSRRLQFVLVNVLGGLAVLGSYAFGFAGGTEWLALFR